MDLKGIKSVKEKLIIYNSLYPLLCLDHSTAAKTNTITFIFPFVISVLISLQPNCFILQVASNHIKIFTCGLMGRIFHSVKLKLFALLWILLQNQLYIAGLLILSLNPSLAAIDVNIAHWLAFYINACIHILMQYIVFFFFILSFTTWHYLPYFYSTATMKIMPSAVNI